MTARELPAARQRDTAPHDGERPASGEVVALNSSHPQRWRNDLTTAEVSFNKWFLDAGQEAYRTARQLALDDFQQLMTQTRDLSTLQPDILRRTPALLGTLRMCTAPRLARERLVSLAFTDRTVLTALEQGRRPARISAGELDAHLERICSVIRASIDLDLFSWVIERVTPTPAQRRLAAFVIADRRCEAVTDQILRIAQRGRQARHLEDYLSAHGYRRSRTIPTDLTMAAGTFAVGQITWSGQQLGEVRVEAIIQPKSCSAPRPIVIKAISTTDVAKVSKRLKDATQLRLMSRNPDGARPLLMLSGSLEVEYLRDRADEGLDWVWEHRLEDLNLAGV